MVQKFRKFVVIFCIIYLGCQLSSRKRVSDSSYHTAKNITDTCVSIEAVPNKFTLIALREKELASKTVNNEILLGFELGMTKEGYLYRIRNLIRSGKLKKWSETTYYATLFMK